MGTLVGMATPRTASRRPDALTLEVVELIGEVVARYHEEYEEAAAGHALTGAQARLLSLLSLEPLPMRRLAQRLKCEPSNVTGIVDRLEARGLVERRPDPADRRVKLAAAATDEGRRVARGLQESLRFAREPLAGLSDQERVALRDALRRMLGTPGDALRPDPGGAGRFAQVSRDGARFSGAPPEEPLARLRGLGFRFGCLRGRVRLGGVRLRGSCGGCSAVGSPAVAVPRGADEAVAPADSLSATSDSLSSGRTRTPTRSPTPRRWETRPASPHWGRSRSPTRSARPPPSPRRPTPGPPPPDAGRSRARPTPVPPGSVRRPRGRNPRRSAACGCAGADGRPPSGPGGSARRPGPRPPAAARPPAPDCPGAGPHAARGRRVRRQVLARAGVVVPGAAAVAVVPVAVPVARVGPQGRAVVGRGLLTGAQRLHGRAATRAGQSAVEVPSARVTKVHDAGRLGSGPVRFLGLAVKVWCGPLRNGFETAETETRATH